MRLRIQGNSLTIEPSLLEKALAFRGSPEIPLDVIQRVSTEAPRGDDGGSVTGWGRLPWLFKKGTYLTRRGWEFWYFTLRSKSFLTLELSGGYYNRIVLGVDDSECWAKAISGSIRERA